MLLSIIFAVSVAGMFAIPLRHYPRVRAREGDSSNLTENSVIRAEMTKWVDGLERWYHGPVKNTFLKLLDSMLRLFERGAGRVAGSTKHLRLMVQERFRVIPRESLYWKNIHAWKKTNGTSLRSELWEDEKDISNHVER